jgi:hypothetical protein
MAKASPVSLARTFANHYGLIWCGTVAHCSPDSASLLGDNLSCGNHDAQWDEVKKERPHGRSFVGLYYLAMLLTQQRQSLLNRVRISLVLTKALLKRDRIEIEMESHPREAKRSLRG